MKKLFIAATAAALTLASCTEQKSPRTETLLTDWEFTLADDAEVMPAEGWNNVRVPHDWAIAGPFDRKYDLQEVAVVQNGEQTATVKTGRSGGLPWMGKGWYRTNILTNEADHCYTLVFDGAMSHAAVYVNGEQVAYWPYGYNTFYVDITPYVVSDTTQIAVSLENKEQSSRWYPGAGLYRNVHLIATQRTHVPVWGTCLTTPVVGADSALVKMQIELNNPTPETTVQTVFLFDGKQVGKAEGTDISVVISKPQLWSPEQANLYSAVTRVYNGKELADTYTTRFGIRSISYSAEHGFQLNGQTRKFKGVCLHHDLGPLGTAVYKDAIRHQLTLLKDMGCDAIRTSHNMPAPELISLCEEMGFMVMVEPFDVWDWGKTDNDYHVHFNDWAEKDITNMVLHYRNSPAVVMWSSGNEVWNQTFAEGYKTVEKLQAIFHRLDPTRPVTCGMDQVGTVIYNGFAAAVEVVGFNYRTGRYVEAHDTLPQGYILGSETASTVSSRGVYKTPALIQPDAMYADNQCSGYDLEYCSWSGLPEQDFALQDDYDWTIGQFVWTGFDYLGEPSPYDTDAWPSHSSYFGIIDLASLPKDRYYLYRSQWNTTSPTLHLLPHWNWEEGQTVPVYCYTSYPEAELFVNGVSQGRLRFATAAEADSLKNGVEVPGVSPMPRVGNFQLASWGTAPQPQLLPRYRLMWHNVRYEAGELKIVAYNKNGKAAEEKIIRTAGEPHHLQAEWVNKNEATEEGLIYLTLSVRDADGNLCPNADNLMKICLSGNAKLLGVGNGNAADLTPFQGTEVPAFAGQATAILQAHGTFAVTISADGLQSATMKQ